VSASDVPTIRLLGVDLARLETQEALGKIEDLYGSGEPSLIAFTNAHTLNLAAEQPTYKKTLGRAALRLNDGKGVMIAAWFRGKRFPHDLNGNFFTPRILSLAAERGWSVYFLGAAPGVAEVAAGRLVRLLPGLKVVGVRDGYFSPAEEGSIVERIRSSGADVVLAGLGNPLQERWLLRHLAGTGARIGVGVGAFFDFQAGEVERAPYWMNLLGLEWLHRLVLEPRRMWRRYVLGNPRFLYRAAREALGGRATRVRGPIDEPETGIGSAIPQETGNNLAIPQETGNNLAIPQEKAAGSVVPQERGKRSKARGASASSHSDLPRREQPMAEQIDLAPAAPKDEGSSSEEAEHVQRTR